MNYSSIHKWFATLLSRHLNINEQDVLDNPEEYLGPNYKELLNFWFYWDSMSHKQRSVYLKRWWDLGSETREKSLKTADELAKEVIDHRVVEFLFCREKEIVAAHLYIERGIPFTYLPLIFDL